MSIRSSVSAGAADDKQLIAQTGALAYVVATQPDQQISHWDLGRAVRDSKDHLSNIPECHQAALRELPVLFSLRDGWHSAELERALRAACALQVLRVRPGGVIVIGPKVPHRAGMLRLVSTSSEAAG